MGNVSKAMKKHRAEQAEQAQRAEQVGEAPVNAVAEAATGERVKAATGGRVKAATEKHTEDVRKGVAKVTKPAAARVMPGLSKANGYSEAMIVHHHRGGTLAEEYRALRTNLLAMSSSGRFCYVITSPGRGDGKTVTSVNLALVMAEIPDRRTLVVDFDLRRDPNVSEKDKSIAEHLHTKHTPGMRELLLGTVELADVVQPTAYGNLFLIPAGEIRQEEAGEVTGRGDIDGIVADFRRRYDYVLLDTPPINDFSEAGILGRAVGEALLVVKMNRTKRESIETAIGLLHAANVNPAGMILTSRRFPIPRSIYKYS